MAPHGMAQRSAAIRSKLNLLPPPHSDPFFPPPLLSSTAPFSRAAKKGDSACIGNISSVGTFVLCSLPRLEKLAGSCVHVVDAPRMYYYDRETGNCGDDANVCKHCKSTPAWLREQLRLPFTPRPSSIATSHSTHPFCCRG